ncbi:MAG: hypothetical protein ACRDSZ_01445, partial [Pseudonocardiaceae bacterium]
AGDHRARLNVDLPQVPLAVVSNGDWADPVLVARRHTYFAHIDEIVIRRVPKQWRTFSTVCSTPQLGRQRPWLHEARERRGANAALLEAAPQQSPDAGPIAGQLSSRNLG